jgi:hypothetical protein
MSPGLDYVEELVQSRNRLRLRVTARRSAPYRAYVRSMFAGQPPPFVASPHTGHIGLGIHASVIFTVAFLLATLCLVFAASGSADDPVDAGSTHHPHVTSESRSRTEAVDGPAAAAHSPESVPSQESPSGPEVSVPRPWPWVEAGPGHDKCKRQKPWPLPTWCSGLSSWPVLRAQAVTARVGGIRGVGSTDSPARSDHRDR